MTVALAVLSIIASVLGTKLDFAEKGAPPTPLANALSFSPVLQVDGGYVFERLEPIKRGQVWRLVTPIFLHFGILHLLFNLFILFDLASMIEQRRGSLFLIFLVLVTAIVSNVAEYYMSLSLTDVSFGANPFFGGMSGVNYALFGYAWMKGKYQPHQGIGVAQQTVTVMLFWLVLCFTGLVGSIANVAHVAGLLAGVAIAYVPYAVGRTVRRR